MSRWRILSTKTLDASVAELLQQNNMELIQVDFIQTTPSIPGANASVIGEIGNGPVVFTSSNAVYAVEKHLRKKRFQVFCMEGKTREAVEDVLVNAEIIGSSDSSKEIAEMIIEKKVSNVTFFCGNIRRDELPSLLAANDIGVKELVVYNTKETPVKIMESFDAVLFFSPSAARSFFSENSIGKHQVCFSIGNTTAGEVAKQTSHTIIVAKKPTQHQVAAAVIDYYKTKVQS